MAPPLSTRAKWGTGLVINVLALSLASYVTLLYHYGTTRRVLAECAISLYNTSTIILPVQVDSSWMTCVQRLLWTL